MFIAIIVIKMLLTNVVTGILVLKTNLVLGQHISSELKMSIVILLNTPIRNIELKM